MTARRVELTSTMPAAPTAVWHAVMSPEIAPIIDPSVREWRPDRTPVGVGTRFTIGGRLGVVPIRGQSEVTCWDPPRQAVFESVTGSGPLLVTATHSFEPAGTGTRYTWRIDLEGPRVAAAIGARLFRRATERQRRALAAYLTRSG